MPSVDLLIAELSSFHILINFAQAESTMNSLELNNDNSIVELCLLMNFANTDTVIELSWIKTELNWAE